MTRALAFIVVCFLSIGNVFAATDFPTADGFVTDVSGVITAATEAALEAKLAAHEGDAGTEIAVAIIPKIPDDMSANEYATELGNAWGVGKKGADNGALLLIETDDVPGQRDIYIAAGSQTEGALTDLASAAIVNEVIVPRFQNGDIDGGVTAGVDAMIAALHGESFTNLRMAQPTSSKVNWHGVIIFGIIALQWLGAILGRSKSIWLGGVLGGIAGGVLGLIFLSNLIAIGGAIIGLALLGLGFDAVVSRAYAATKESGGIPPWWMGGGGFGGGSGGGFGGFGGGGFSGGGGGGKW